MVVIRDFGGLIRRSRERLGLSQSRVAELVGRSPGTVRAWERGRVVPGEATVVASLAAVLDIEESALFDAAGLAPPASPPVQTLEESLASIAPQSEGSRTEPARPQGTPPVSAVTEEAATEPVARNPGNGYDDSSDTPSVLARLGAILQQMLARRAQPKRRPYGGPVVVGPSAGRPSYVEDPEQRLVYRVRTVLTVLGIAVLAVVLLWAAGNAMEALGQAWETLTEGL